MDWPTLSGETNELEGDESSMVITGIVATPEGPTSNIKIKQQNIKKKKIHVPSMIWISLAGELVGSYTKIKELRSKGVGIVNY